MVVEHPSPQPRPKAGLGRIGYRLKDHTAPRDPSHRDVGPEAALRQSESEGAVLDSVSIASSRGCGREGVSISMLPRSEHRLHESRSHRTKRSPILITHPRHSALRTMPAWRVTWRRVKGLSVGRSSRYGNAIGWI